MSSKKVGDVHVLIGAKDLLSKTLMKAKKSLRGFAKAASRIAIAGGVAIGGMFAYALKEASASEEIMNKFNVVFGDSAKEMQKWGDTFAGQVGRAKSDVAEWLAGTQDLLVPMGVDPELAKQSSKAMTKLAVDLASFNNMADADVMANLQAALTGSGAVMKKYGVVLNEATLKQELLNQGLDPKTADTSQKAMARLNIIIRGTTAAQGDAIRSGGSFANQMKKLKSTIADVAGEIGAKFLPFATQVVKVARALVLHWPEVWTLIRDSTLLSITGMWEDIKHTFGVKIPAIISWLGENWQTIFKDMVFASNTMVLNLANNIKDVFVEIWKFITSGFEGGFGGLMSNIGEIAGRDLLEGFQAQTKAMPNIAERQMTEYEKELTARMAKASTKIAEAAFGDKAADGGGPLEEMTIPDSAAGAAAAKNAMKESQETTGTFAAGAQFSAGRTFQKKMEKNTERTAKATEAIKEAVENSKGTPVAFVT